MKNFEIETKAVNVRVWATTTYPKVWGGKAGDQTRVCIYANDNNGLAEAVIAEAKKAKVEKTVFRCMGCEVVFSRYTDSHFTIRKWGVTQKITSGAYHRLLNDFRNSSDWYEVG